MKSIKLVFEKQVWHYLLLAILLAAVLIAVRLDERFLEGAFLGVSTPAWFCVALGVPVFHTLYVWFCWRTQLYNSLLSRWFGGKAFAYYSALFYILLATDPVYLNSI